MWRRASSAARSWAYQGGFNAQISPDGRWLAYASDESGRNEVYVTDFPAARLKRPVSVDGGSAPAWASDGKELFFVSGTWMMSATVVRGDPIAFARPVRLFDGLESAGGVINYSVAPDGRFLFVQPSEDAAARRSQLTLVLNWDEELKQRVPLKERNAAPQFPYKKGNDDTIISLWIRKHSSTS